MLNKQKLKLAESEFFNHYPGGFDNPEMIKVGKKHKMHKMVEMASDSFSKKAFKNVDNIANDMIKIISRSSMVSMFEKPKFKDFVIGLNNHDKDFLVQSLKKLLHGKQQAGFEALVDLLKTEKLAKWSLISIIPAYYSPDHDVFVKPTTAKDVIRYFEVKDLIYKPAPTWEFYDAYRDIINKAKLSVDKTLSPSNAAFSGFLMMSVKSEIA